MRLDVFEFVVESLPAVNQQHRHNRPPATESHSASFGPPQPSCVITCLPIYRHDCATPGLQVTIPLLLFVDQFDSTGTELELDSTLSLFPAKPFSYRLISPVPRTLVTAEEQGSNGAPLCYVWPPLGAQLTQCHPSARCLSCASAVRSQRPPGNRFS
jgi:hypothetical protein